MNFIHHLHFDRNLLLKCSDQSPICKWRERPGNGKENDEQCNGKVSKHSPEFLFIGRFSFGQSRTDCDDDNRNGHQKNMCQTKKCQIRISDLLFKVSEEKFNYWTDKIQYRANCELDMGDGCSPMSDRIVRFGKYSVGF